jgi:hypothetical protein
VSFTLSTVNTGTGTAPVGLFARRTDNSNFYYLRILPAAHATDSVQLYKRVAAVSTLLGTYDAALANNDSFQLVVTDAAKKVYYNGLEIISSTDNALTSVGTWGFYIGNFNGAGGNLNQTWDITSLQAGGGSGWWDSAYLKREQLTLTAPASGLPSGYPVRFELDHAALVGAGDSQADGDDIRIVYWNGSVWTEVARTLFNNNLTASAWNVSTTAIMFNTQAAIAGSGSDSGYYMYYRNSSAASPPITTLSSRYFVAESLGATNGTAAYVSKVSLSFTPRSASQQWVVVGSWRQQHSGAGANQLVGESQITVNGTARTGTPRVGYMQEGNSWKTFSSILRITGVITTQTVTIDFINNGGTDQIDKARLIAFMIPDATSANAQYGESLAITTDTVNPTSALTTTFTPSSAGNYVWLSSGSNHEGPGGAGPGGLFAVDEAGTEQQETDNTWLTQTESFAPFTHFEQRNLTTGSKTFIIRHRPDTTTGSERQGLTQLLFRSDVFDLVEVTDSAAQNSTTSTTYVDKSPALTVSTASTGSNRDYIYLVVMGMYETTGLLTTAGEVRLDGVQQTEDVALINRTGFEHQVSWAYAETSTGGRTINARYKSSTGQTAWAHYGHILSLRYKNPTASLGSEQTNSVSITVRVQHTDTSGGDPQLITSATTVINAATADPLALALGSGLQQTFTAADPRLLRVEIEVTAVSGAGTFTLDYDGTCATSRCSNLNTPVVTVPEGAVALAAVGILIPILTAGVWRRKRLGVRARQANSLVPQGRRASAKGRPSPNGPDSASQTDGAHSQPPV